MRSLAASTRCASPEIPPSGAVALCGDLLAYAVRPGRRRSRVGAGSVRRCPRRLRIWRRQHQRLRRAGRLLGGTVDAGDVSCGRSRSDASAILDALLRRAVSGRGRLARARQRASGRRRRRLRRRGVRLLGAGHRPRLHATARLSPDPRHHERGARGARIRLRKGSANTQKAIVRFCDEPIARVQLGRRDRLSSCGAPTLGCGMGRGTRGLTLVRSTVLITVQPVADA